MASLFHSFGFLFALAISAHISSALELVEIRPGGDLSAKSRLRPRDTSVLDLQSTETFLWGADSKLHFSARILEQIFLLIDRRQ
jgi:hypothetical protein